MVFLIAIFGFFFFNFMSRSVFYKNLMSIFYVNLRYINIFLGCIILLPLSLFSLNYSLYKTLFLILCWHIIITIPLLYFISYKYKIDRNYICISNTSFQHPYFIFTIATGIIYPLIWGFFLSFSRYFRLGTTIDISIYLNNWQDFIIVSVFLLYPNILIWVRITMRVLMNYRQVLWNYTESLSFSIHIWALQYYDYFRFCQIIHKFHFILYDLIFLYPGAFYRCFSESIKEPSFIKFTKFLRFFHSNIWVLHLIMLLNIILEIVVFKGKIYFGIYILFLYPSLLALIRMFHTIGSQNLILNMCLSDYLTLNFINPRYPFKFWFYARNPQLWYNVQHSLPTALQNIYEKTMIQKYLIYENFSRFHNKLPYRVHGYMFNKNFRLTSPKIYGIKVGLPQRLGIRVAAYYKSQYGVRWFSTTRSLRSPISQNLHHPFTAKFIKDPYAILVLLNKPEQNFAQIQQLTKHITNWPKPQHLYDLNSNILLTNPKTLTDVLEANFVMRFKLLTEQNVIVGTYKIMKERYGYNNLQTMQMRPDMVSNWINNKAFIFKGFLGIDEKHKMISSTNVGRHQAINSITSEDYIELIKIFELKLEQKNKLTEEIRAILNEFQEIAKKKDFDALLEIWSNNLHIFPDKWKPPLMIEKTFDYTHLTPETLEKIRKGELIVQKISDTLYTLNISEETGEFPPEVLDIFDGSFIQDIMNK
jgi:hypothetical protein